MRSSGMPLGLDRWANKAAAVNSRRSHAPINSVYPVCSLGIVGIKVDGQSGRYKGTEKRWVV